MSAADRSMCAGRPGNGPQDRETRITLQGTRDGFHKARSGRTCGISQWMRVVVLRRAARERGVEVRSGNPVDGAARSPRCDEVADRLRISDFVAAWRTVWSGRARAGVTGPVCARGASWFDGQQCARRGVGSRAAVGRFRLTACPTCRTIPAVVTAEVAGVCRGRGGPRAGPATAPPRSEKALRARSAGPGRRSRRVKRGRAVSQGRDDHGAQDASRPIGRPARTGALSGPSPSANLAGVAGHGVRPSFMGRPQKRLARLRQLKGHARRQLSCDPARPRPQPN